jgi:hypothetical protein
MVKLTHWSPFPPPPSSLSELQYTLLKFRSSGQVESKYGPLSPPLPLVSSHLHHTTDTIVRSISSSLLHPNKRHLTFHCSARALLRPQLLIQMSAQPSLLRSFTVTLLILPPRPLPSSSLADLLIAEGMLNPTVSSKGMVKHMKSNPMASNRFQDIWVWNGRPNWDEIFQVSSSCPCSPLPYLLCSLSDQYLIQENRENRQHSDVGVCFCGAPAIGAVSSPPPPPLLRLLFSRCDLTELN